MPRRLPLAAFGFVLVVTMAFVACSSGDSNGGVSLPRPTLTLAPVQPRQTTLVDPQGPTGLTPAQTQDAQSIIESDPVVQELAAGAIVTTSQVGGYFFGQDPETKKELLVGATAHVMLSRPVNHDSIALPDDSGRPFYNDWPDDLQARYVPFEERLRTYRLTGVTQFQVDLDFSSRRVIRFLLDYGVTNGAQTFLSLDPTPSDFPQNVFLGSEGPDSAHIRSIAESFPAIARIKKDHPNGGLAYGYSIGDHHFGYYYTGWDGGVPLSGDWPEIIDMDYTTGDYRSETIHASEDLVNTLNVTVDLDTGLVISIETQYRD